MPPAKARNPFSTNSNEMDMHPIFEQMLHTWTNGGWVLPALALLALITYATVAQLLVALHYPGLRKATDNQIRSWVAQPSRAPKSIRELIRYSQDEVRSLDDVAGRFKEVEAASVSDVDRRIAFVNVLVVAAPLFGLLGTVLGMLLTFKAIGIGGSSTSEIIARGISEALVATQTGMMVAIPGLLMSFLAKRWRTEYVAFLARLEGITLRHLRSELPETSRTEGRQTTTAPEPQLLPEPIPA
jgi:biopolymer transport protein ExbB